jgi:hypothetical protein
VDVSLENDAPSVAAIAAVRPAMRDKLFPPEATAAIASISSLRINANVIDEFHSVIKPQEREGGKFQASRPNSRWQLLLD